MAGPPAPSVLWYAFKAVLRYSSVWPAIAIAAAGCDVGDPFTSTNELADNPGTIVAAASPIPYASSLVWSSDGQSVTFELEGGTLAEYDVGTGQVTTRDGARDQHAELAAAPAGDAVYFLADRQGGLRSAYRLAAGGTASRLTDRAPGSDRIVPGDGHLVLGDQNDRRVAYINYPDSLFLYDNESAERRFVLDGCARVIAFAPDGEKLLCKRPQESLFGIVDLEVGSITGVSLQPAERESILLRTRWSATDSIHSLYRTQSRFRVRSTASGDAFTVWIPQFFQGVRATDFMNFAWSADGGRFVFWSHECLKLDRVGRCDRGQSVLYAVDLHNNSGKPVAVVKGERGAVQVAISPDGSQAAFVFEGRLHMQIIP